MLQFLLADCIDILIITNIKLDSTFPSSQLQIHGFRTSYRLDQTDRREGILLIEINLRKKKVKKSCCYNSYKILINYHLQESTKGILIYSKKYDGILLMRNFNAEVSKTSFYFYLLFLYVCMCVCVCVCELYDVKSVINQSTCYKNSTVK